LTSWKPDFETAETVFGNERFCGLSSSPSPENTLVHDWNMMATSTEVDFCMDAGDYRIPAKILDHHLTT
jgi:hypothetical protein